ncbi:glycosyltransferase family 2 protein [Ochrobactrum anthropi ATCC 49188]|nr:glycosyltransferase family 2 protein [Brucella anthropi ATCC 49188]
MKLSIAIPCYNEALNIPLIVTRLREIIVGRDDVEVLLVDNGSKDNTADVLRRELQEGDAIRVITVPVNQGYGYGILRGLEAASGEVLAWTHADMQTDPRDVLIAFDLYKEHAGQKIIVKGKRRNRQLLERFLLLACNRLRLLYLGCRLMMLMRSQSCSHANSIRNLSRPARRMIFRWIYTYCTKRGYTVIAFWKYQSILPNVFTVRQRVVATGKRALLIRRTFAYIFDLRRELAAQQGQDS